MLPMPEEQCKLDKGRICRVQGRLPRTRSRMARALVGVEVFEALFDGVEGALGLVLADLPLAFDSGDGDLDADDALHLRCDVVCGGVADLPGCGRAGLVLRGEGVEVWRGAMWGLR